jgi:hypothetical protein
MSKILKWIKRRSLARYRFWFLMRLLLTIIPFIVLSVGLIVVATSSQAAMVKEWKEVFLVFGTGIITFTAAYSGAAMENYREKERELRQARRNRAQIYREYLLKTLTLMQRIEFSADFQQIGAANLYHSIQVSNSERDEMLKNLPPILHFSIIENDECRDAVDKAIMLGIAYWNEEEDNRPAEKDLQDAFVDAVQQLDYYENLS